MQLNCNGRREVAPALALLMVERHVQIALLQEQYRGPTGIAAGFPAGMRVYGRAGTSSAVVINSATIEAVMMEDLTTEHGVCVWTKGEFGELVVCSVYCQFRDPLEPYVAYMERVAEAAGATPLLLATDANCVSPLWHSKVRRNRRDGRQYGEEAQPLEELLARQNLQVLNEPCEHFTFAGPAGQSDIDVTVGNSALLGYESSWRVLPGELTSDHNAIEIDITTNRGRPTREPLTIRWNTRGADWRMFREHIAESASRVDVERLSVDELQAAYDQVVTAACEACLRKEQSTRARTQQWWTADLAL